MSNKTEKREAEVAALVKSLGFPDDSSVVAFPGATVIFPPGAEEAAAAGNSFASTLVIEDVVRVTGYLVRHQKETLYDLVPEAAELAGFDISKIKGMVDAACLEELPVSA